MTRSTFTDQKSIKLLAQAKNLMARMKTSSTPKSRAAMNKLSPSQRRQIKTIGKLVAAGKSSVARSKIQVLINGMPKKQAKALNIRGVMLEIMRQSYQKNLKDLQSYATKVKEFNKRKATIRAEITRARSYTDKKIEIWDQKLTTVGEDAQLANIDLQNGLQKAQQMLQMMSNVSKMLHDTAMAIIRKNG